MYFYNYSDMRNLLTFLFILFTSVLYAQHWNIQEMSPMPERVSNNAVVEGFINGEPYVYSFAGIDSTLSDSGIHLRSYRYSVNDDVWQAIPPLPDDMGKVAASASRVGDIIYIIGGYYVFPSGREESSDKVHRYDIASNTYLSDGAPIPVAIDDQTQVVWRDSLIYVVTGWSDFTNVVEVQIYNPTLDEWSSGTSVPVSHDYRSFGSSGVIIDDVIYYFGGAESRGLFPIQSDFRMGVIDPDDPLQIDWSLMTLGTESVGYRMAASVSQGRAFWIGGALETYNFDGLAYDDSAPVSPANRSLLFDPKDGFSESDFSNALPMDLRGIAEVSDTRKYVVGGILDNRYVSDKVWRLDLNLSLLSSTQNVELIEFSISPNPVDNKLNIRIPESGTGDNLVSIYNSSGLLMTEVKLNDATVNVSSLPSGLYMIKLESLSKVGYRKFIKK
jgi:hypothetical protein